MQYSAPALVANHLPNTTISQQIPKLIQQEDEEPLRNKGFMTDCPFIGMNLECCFSVKSNQADSLHAVSPKISLTAFSAFPAALTMNRLSPFRADNQPFR